MDVIIRKEWLERDEREKVNILRKKYVWHKEGKYIIPINKTMCYAYLTSRCIITRANFIAKLPTYRYKITINTYLQRLFQLRCLVWCQTLSFPTMQQTSFILKMKIVIQRHENMRCCHQPPDSLDLFRHYKPRSRNQPCKYYPYFTQGAYIPLHKYSYSGLFSQYNVFLEITRCTKASWQKFPFWKILLKQKGILLLMP